MNFSYSNGMLATDGEKLTLCGSGQIGCASQDQRLEENYNSAAPDDAKLKVEIHRAVSASQTADFARNPTQQTSLIFVDKSLVLATPQSQIVQAKSSDSPFQVENVSQSILPRNPFSVSNGAFHVDKDNQSHAADGK